MAKSISLIGLPGSGKSTIGRHLAKRLKWQFVDSDSIVEKKLGCDIRTFFDLEGESRFRDIEAEVIASLVEIPRIVLATGGGAVLRVENRQLLKSATDSFYLFASPQELVRRLRNDVRRPLLQVQDPHARLCSLYEQRDPLYRAVARFIVEAGRSSVASSLDAAMMQLELAGIIDTPLKPPT